MEMVRSKSEGALRIDRQPGEVRTRVYDQA